MSKKDVVGMLPQEIKEDIPSFRSSQILTWLKSGIRDFDQMTNLPKELRQELKERYSIYRPRVLKKQCSPDGTIKYLWELQDGNAVETVLMKNNYGNTVCISTQVGCRQGCAFCASTIGGLVRSLESSEIVNEVVFSSLESGEPISNIVLMGIGEPLDNYDNVIRALKILNHPDLYRISLRHVSLSTCGILERFEDLASENLPLTLALSLHAPDDETRTKLMPANRNRGVAALMKACKDYTKKTGRRVSFEYAMINEVNDSPNQALKLSALAKDVGAHINLITLNHVDESPLKPSSTDRLKAFMKVLDEQKVNYTLRRKLGTEIDAACGQLRRKWNFTDSRTKE